MCMFLRSQHNNLLSGSLPAHNELMTGNLRRVYVTMAGGGGAHFSRDLRDYFVWIRFF